MRARITFRNILLASSALVPLGFATALANPQGPAVVGGSATVSGVNTPNVTVNQSTDRAIINWQSFNIGAGETTRFVQPGAGSITLNRVNGNLGPSQIHGALTANGRVFLVNPDGILIGRGGTINTAGFLASTHDISNSHFMTNPANRPFQFNVPGRPDASIVNEGRINSHSQGFAALVAPGVRNSGTITARFGTIGLAAAGEKGFSLDLYGDRLISLAVNDSVAATVKDVATGQSLKSLVTNDGKLKANGGRVELTAASARTLVDSVINNTGVIEARSIGHRQGKIVLGGPTASTKVAGAPTQTVKVSGTLNTSSRRGRGGTIQVTGEAIEIRAASFDASGATGGGKILIGGDVGGGQGHNAAAGIPQAGLEAGAIPTATTVTVDAASTFNASARGIGDGGKVVVWADDATAFSGAIQARGGEGGGNGGFAEISGKQTLTYLGTADMRAPKGSFGTVLLDPQNYTIGGVSGANSISVADLTAALNSGNYIVTNNAGAGDGDIFITQSFGSGWSASTLLTVSAFRHVTISDNVTISNTAGGSIKLVADNTGTGTGTINMTQATLGSRIDWTGSTGTVRFYSNQVYSNPTIYLPSSQGAGRGVLTNANVDKQFISYMLVNSAADLQSMVDPGGAAINGSYALSKNVTGGAFTAHTFTFRGDFDGQNFSVSNLTINGPGLFQAVSGTIRNLTLSGLTVNATANNQTIGGLAGQLNSGGQIINSHTGGTLNAAAFTGAVAGGLVGLSNGKISDSSSSMNINSSGLNSNLGGLVGHNNKGATILKSSASGNVTSSANVAAQSSDCTSCQFVNAGGLVGQNNGTIGTSSGSPVVFATGAVTVGSNANAGGLVGYSSGIIWNAYATGAIAGAAGTAGGSNITKLGGLAGFNSGLVGYSYATGNVGSASTDRLKAGGLVAENNGYIAASYATGNVSAGNSSQAGGLAGSADTSNCNNCSFGDGSDYANLGLIALSYATGAVTVGSQSLAGGLVGTGSVIAASWASGAVRGGDNSILGGLVGAHNVDGFIYSSYAYGSVTSTGPYSWIGGFVGANGGYIFSSDAYGAVSGTANSVLGGFSATNIGWISDASAAGSVSASGTGNVLGGFGGVNFGLIDNVSASGSLSHGGLSTAGGLIGANATYVNFQSGDIPLSTFPVGTLASSATSGGAASHPLVGITNPSALPTNPSPIASCNDTMCTVFNTGVLGGTSFNSSSSAIPDEILAPPNSQFRPPRFDRQEAPPVLIRFGNLNPPRPPGGGTGPGAGAGPGPQGGAVRQPGATPPDMRPQQFTRPPAIDGNTLSGLPPLNETRFNPAQVLVQFDSSVSQADIQRIANQFGLTITSTQTVSSTGRTAYQFQIGGGRSVRDLIRALEQNRLAVSVQPNYVYGLVQQTPAAAAAPVAVTAMRGDPAQYMMSKLHLNEAHRVASGNNITVAVIDSEVDESHAELAGRIAARFDATQSQSRAHSHGTAMAGAIVARDRLLGVAPNARILAVRAFSETQTSAESTTLTILKGIEWAVSQGARVINMSFAGPYDPVLERALRDAAAKGVILVAASGNAGPKSPPLWPGADSNVIAVTATDSRDQGFRQANRGPYVSVASPGVDILAPAPEAAYQMSTGTSIATAHVSGVIALMLERDPSLTPRDVRLILESTANDLGPKGRDAQFGWGLVNTAKALAMVEERKRQKDSGSTAPLQR